MQMKQTKVLILLLYILHKSQASFILASSNDNSGSETLNFNTILEENRKYSKVSNYCPLRIAGGVNAEIGQIPYQVVLRRKTPEFYLAYCGGSLITLKFVITAAHCIIQKPAVVKNVSYPLPASAVRVTAGTIKTHAEVVNFLLEEEHSRGVKKLYKHKKHIVGTGLHDMGIVELERRFIESDSIRPIRLHTLKLDGDVKINEQCLLSGYGTMEGGNRSETLKMVCVSVMSMKQCKKYLGGSTDTTFTLRTAMCAGSDGVGHCRGDSGGPLACRGVLVGIVSWGRNQCGTGPGVYTKVSLYTDNSVPPFSYRNRSALPRNRVEPIGQNYTLLWWLYLICVFTSMNKL